MTRTRPRSRPALAAVLAAATLLAACSVPRLAYRQADWLLLRQMDSYLDLAGEQRDRVAKALEVRLEQHRASELPDFASAFGDAAARARRGLSSEDARWVVDRTRALVLASVDGTLPVLAQALAELTPAQQAHLAARLDERNRDYREDHALDRPREERLRRRAERTVERIEDWTGPLSEEQVALVHSLRDAMPELAAGWLAYTVDRQRALLGLLEAGAGAAAVESFLRGWWVRLEHMPGELERARAQRLAATAALLVRLDETLDSVQRAHLVRKLEGLSEDARTLARET